MTRGGGEAEGPRRSGGSLGAALTPWRCEGTLKSGRPCGKLLAEVDMARPIYARATCGRCGHVSTLVEPYPAQDVVAAAQEILRRAKLSAN